MPVTVEADDDDSYPTQDTRELSGIANVVSDDEDENDVEDANPQSSNVTRPPTSFASKEDTFTIDDNMNDHAEFAAEDAAEAKSIRETNDIMASTDSGELLRYHYKLGHLPFANLKTLAKIGAIPKKLQHAKPPMCASCTFGKMCRRNWRTRANSKRKIVPASAPGHVVSVDQMESSTAGFIGQLKGIPTTRRNKYATIFVDHFSDLSYVHLQETISSQDTILAKRAFESYAREQGVR